MEEMKSRQGFGLHIIMKRTLPSLPPISQADQFTELYPSEKSKALLDIDGKSTFNRGEKARVVVPADSCFLFELKRVEKASGPILAGIEGNVARKGSVLEITGVSGKPGVPIDFSIRLPGAEKITKLTVNGVARELSLSARVLDRSEHRVAIDITDGRATIRKPLLHYFKYRDDKATGGSARAINTDKTLVSWARLADKNVKAGSILTVQDGNRFDGTVFAELSAGKWMAGSDTFRRTNKEQGDWAVEKADAKSLVQTAIVYKGDRISIYRNGKEYASYKTKNVPSSLSRFPL